MMLDYTDICFLTHPPVFHQWQVLRVMEKLVGRSWNEGNCPLFFMFPSPSLAVCMDGTLHKYTFTVEGNCFSLRESFDMF